MAITAESGRAADTASPEQQTGSDSSELDQKRVRIQQACEQQDLQLLVQLADSSGGLLEDHLRQLAWPLLLGCSGSEDHNGSRWKRLAVHRDEEQVHKDVDRAFVHYPSDEPEKTTETRKGVLYDLIVRILRSHPMLCYFQGFHDIAQVLLLVLGANAAYPAIESVCLLRIRDYMLPTIGPAVKPLELLPVILQAADQELARHLTLPHANYALPATLTLYAHIIEQYSDIARLFDFILAHEPVMSVYLFAGTILSRREQILEIPADDHDMMFFVLQKLPQPLDLEPLISNALAMFAEHPPGRLPGRVWRNISSSSVLKTAQVPERNHDLNLAMLYFQRQAAEIRWDETKKNAARMAKKYKRPAATTAAAVAIGALSIWMRRSGNDRSKRYNFLNSGEGGVDMMATQTARGYVVLPTTSFTPTTPPDLLLKQPQPHRSNAHLIVKMANRGYDVVVDVDQEGDLGHTDLQDDDLEFHQSNFNQTSSRKIQPDSTPFLSSATNPANLPQDTPPTKRMLWSLSFYAQFFDVDTSTVLHRCRTALIPFLPHTPPFLDTLDGNPDLYGPFWIATTVVVILFLTGTISHKLASENKKHFEYDFKLLSGAAGLIYGYTLFVPLGLWGALRWFGAQGLELVECWSLYGYGNLFWIGVALLSWSPLNGLNYALVGLGYAVSVFFLLKNLYPVISATEKKVSQVLLIVVVLLHAGLAVAVKVLFFSHKSPAKQDGDQADGDRMLMSF